MLKLTWMQTCTKHHDKDEQENDDEDTEEIGTRDNNIDQPGDEEWLQ